MKPLVYVDGAAGTTGLEIVERLRSRDDLALLMLSDPQRKEMPARAHAFGDADIAILCLPDQAAREAVELVSNTNTRVLDASSAHRTSPGWVYGFPELEPGRRADIAAARRVSNPGCYPTGFLALVRPLVRSGLLPADFPLTVNAVSGYSGGGRTMIQEFEDSVSPHFTSTVVRSYALTLEHKHVAEMQVHGGLSHPPVFAPMVGRYFRGMMVEVPLQLWALPGRPTVATLHSVLAEAYAGEPQIEVEPLGLASRATTLDAEALKGSDRMTLLVLGHEKSRQARLIAVLDNLGKGASGAALQNLNLMLGISETTGLH